MDPTDLIVRWRAMGQAEDGAFADWCNYDMEIEASKVVFVQCADQLQAGLPALIANVLEDVRARIAAQPHIAPCLRLYEHGRGAACLCWMQPALDFIDAQLHRARK